MSALATHPATHSGDRRYTPPCGTNGGHRTLAGGAVRINVSVPDALIERVRAELPDLNVSGVLQSALRRLLECDHVRLVCGDCGEEVDPDDAAIIADTLARFWRELLWAWQPLVDKGGTAEGAARVAKRVAVEMGVPGAERIGIPRPPRNARRAS